ncbi:uncharacterized protein [Acropora muricata]|uniref:uncharacterized protein isoform X1 n=1 Tax=Acropora muricata TaxID=159855 RepID=UPI0034E3E9D5
MKVLVLVATILCILEVTEGSDPCKSYKVLAEADRERKYNQDSGKSDVNDLKADDWYRFSDKAGFRLSNRKKIDECQPGIQCGTSSPGFMIGYNPVREGRTRKRKVCFSQGGNCCAHQVKVKTKRCPGGFLVYMLPAVPTGNGRYCGHARRTKPTKPASTTKPATTTPVHTGEDQAHPGQSCKVIKTENPLGGSGLYWINPDGGKVFQAYCDQEFDGGGWTLVYSYNFTNYRNFASGTNAVWPRPSWPANGDIPESKITPLSETEPGAMDFKLWKLIGHQFMVKSNINHWIVCTEGEGSLVEYKKGSLNCRVVKIIAAACQNVAPDEIRLLTKEAAGNYGPHLWNTKSPTWLKTYYYWESSTQSGNWPTHDPCGQNGLSHVKNVQNPHGNIYIR